MNAQRENELFKKIVRLDGLVNKSLEMKLGNVNQKCKKLNFLILSDLLVHLWDTILMFYFMYYAPFCFYALDFIFCIARIFCLMSM